MKKKDVILGIFIPILCAVIGVAGGTIYTLRQSAEQNSEISIQINNVLNANSENVGVSQSIDLKSSTENLIDAYESTKQQSDKQAQELEDLQAQYERLDASYQELKSENEQLNASYEKLKNFLLQDNRYADDINDLVVVKKTTKHLSDLYIVDSQYYSQLEAIQDFYGDVHSVSYQFHTDSVAQVLYRLDQKYDTFNAKIATTKSTGTDVLISVEIYVDDELRYRRDNITQSVELIPLDTIVLHGAETLKIKAICMAGDGFRRGYVYITDDSLGVVE